MIEFKDISIEHKKICDEYLNLTANQNCESSFGILFIWKDIYKNQIAIVDDFLVVKNALPDGDRFYQPYGKGNIVAVTKKLIENQAEKGQKLKIVCASAEYSNMAKEKFNAKIEANRDYFDYVYLASNLAELKGKKYHAKRNHVNKFRAIYDFRFDEMTPENCDIAIMLSKQWCSENNSCGEKSIRNERCSMDNLTKYFTELEARGLILYIDDKPVAFTAGTPKGDMFIVHFEKAIAGYEGTYAAINNEFANRLKDKFTYINREEDMGLPGLRKSKLSYHPDRLVEKYDVEFE